MILLTCIDINTIKLRNYFLITKKYFLHESIYYRQVAEVGGGRGEAVVPEVVVVVTERNAAIHEAEVEATAGSAMAAAVDEATAVAIREVAALSTTVTVNRYTTRRAINVA